MGLAEKIYAVMSDRIKSEDTKGFDGKPHNIPDHNGKPGDENGFMEKLHAVLDGRIKRTENGAMGYETTGKALVDLNFAAYCMGVNS